MSDEAFFSALPAFERFDDVADMSRYVAAPDSWLLVITDVEGSTRAIEAGRYKDVNALGVASIVALQNACPDIALPFVFGGDGATVLCPASLRPAVEDALRGIRKRAIEGFDMRMRVGIVPLAELRAAGHEVLVARHRASEKVHLAMFAGSGIAEGERWIKDPVRGADYAVTENPSQANADFSGFQCRWKPVPSRRGHMISLLIQAMGASEEDRAVTYRRIIGEIHAIAPSEGRPVSEETMELATDVSAFSAEATLQTGKRQGLGYAIARKKIQILAAVGRSSMRSGKTRFGFEGQKYLKETVANTDYRKFDEMLRMVLDVSDEQKAAIEALLDRETESGCVVYGMHVASSALITCMIEEEWGEHMHFVDGADGGYALAAKDLKAKLARL